MTRETSTYRVTDAYRVTYSHGLTEAFDTYASACAAVRAVYRSAAIGHDGDITHGGERTLCWADATTAKNDDGSRAIASIRVGHEIEVTS